MYFKALTNKICALMALILMISFFVSSGSAFAATQTIVVKESDVARQDEDSVPTKNWVIYTRPAAPGIATFINGPGTPPLNAGSLEFKTPNSSNKVYAFNFDHVGKTLAGIDAMSYSTYRTSGAGAQVTGLNIQVDFVGDGISFTTLVFEPIYNTSQGAVTNGIWQTWDAFKGGQAIWWSTKPIPGSAKTNYANTYVTWQTIISNNPNAKIKGGFGLNQGTGNATLITALDALTLGYLGNTVIYDFELNTPPPSAAQCAAADVTKFNIFTFKNASLTNGGSEITGKVAVGGNANFMNYNIATGQPSNEVNLRVNGTLTLTYGQVRGQIVNNPTAVDATTAEACAKLTSQYWRDQGGTPVASMYGGFQVNAGSGTSYFKLEGSELYNANNLVINAPATATVILNINGTADRLQYMGFSLNGGIGPKNVVLNFHEATTLLVNGITIKGTVWAPYAAVTYQNGGLQGTLVAQSLTGGSTRFENYRYEGPQGSSVPLFEN
jgi:choice-of-anchor A domain-containing protein